ncbi:hypothetical protein DIPPA_04526 [Diplonema papillatum]|nr:hypothetical protein DIPPA_04526 [Diplonema papillatum]
MSGVKRFLARNKVWCLIVGREPDVAVGKGKFKIRNDEARVSLEVGCIMGVAMSTGIVLYYLDKKSLPNTETSVAAAVFPTVTDALAESVERSGDMEATLDRLENQSITQNRAIFTVLMGLAMARTSRVYWARRWGDLEWQRAVVYMPWTSSVGLALYAPIAVSIPVGLACYAYLNREYAREWRPLLSDPRQLLSRAATALNVCLGLPHKI